MLTISNIILAPLNKLFSHRYPTGNVLILDEGKFDFVVRKRCLDGEPRELHIINILIYEDYQSQGLWKEIWKIILQFAKDNDLDRIKVELVYNERWREWFERDGSGWVTVHERDKWMHSVPSYWFTTDDAIF